MALANKLARIAWNILRNETRPVPAQHRVRLNDRHGVAQRRK